MNKDVIALAKTFFSDEISRKIFDKRIEIGIDIKCDAFPETLEFAGCDKAAKMWLLRFIEEIRNPVREKFIYGAGVGCKSILGRESARALDSVAWSGIIDNNVTGARYGLPIITFAEFMADHKDALVLNSVGQPVGSTIHKQCMDAGIDCVSLFELDKAWNQYFDLPKELGLVGEGEVFVHAGCYNGDTQKSYVNWFGDSYAKMVTFEPSAEQFTLCQKNLAGMRDVEIVPAGLSDHSGKVRFDLMELPGLSYINENGSVEIDVVSLDEHLRDQRVTFIALDIEGEELAALRGAERIIKTQKSKLAISAYHKPEDVWELPLLIKEYNPEYKFYLRHYHLLDMAETVLYAL